VRYYAPPAVEDRSIVTSMSVCVSVSPQVYLQNYTYNLEQVFTDIYLWLWLSPPLAALRRYACTCDRMDNYVVFARNGQK